MPSPGAAGIQASIGNVPIPLPGFAGTTIDNTSDTITLISQGVHTGWGALYPTTASACADGIEAAFAGYVIPGWSSFCWLRAIGKGIDNEVAAWVASWDNVAMVHTYAPSVDSVYASMVSEIQACGYSNSHAYPLPYAVAGAFMSGFGQEAG